VTLLVTLRPFEHRIDHLRVKKPVASDSCDGLSGFSSK
jgi:hypothetical protein